jgi:hypothetical protein
VVIVESIFRCGSIGCNRMIFFFHNPLLANAIPERDEIKGVAKNLEWSFK